MRSTLARAGPVVTGRNVENIAGMLRHLLLRVQRPRYTVDLAQTVAAAGWRGSGAAFTTAWDRDAVGAKALAALT